MKRSGLVFMLVLVVSGAAYGFVYETFMATENEIRRVKELGELEPAQLVIPRESRHQSLAMHDDYVYWSSRGVIYRGDVDGSTRETILGDRYRYPQGLTIDPIGEKLYWREGYEDDVEPNRIYRAGLNGSDVEAVAEFAIVGAIALDLDQRKLYWIGFDDLKNPAVMRADLGGTNIENVTPASLPPWHLLPYYLALTVAPDAIYFHGTGLWDIPTSITYKMNLDGTGLEEKTSQFWIFDLQFGRQDGLLYCHAMDPFGSWRIQNIYRVSSISGEWETVLDEHDLERDFYDVYSGNIAVQYQNDQTILWFADSAGIKKKRVPSVELLASSTKSIHDIAFVPGGGVYWSEYSKLGAGAIRRVDSRGGAPETVLSGLYSVSGIAVDTKNGFLYWCDPYVFTIYRSTLAGEDVTSVVSGLARVGMARGLVLDAQREILYWVDPTNGAVKFYNLITRVSGVVTPTAWGAAHLALDSARSTLYFTDNTGLYRVGTDGSDLTVIEDTSFGYPGMMQVDVASGHLYYVKRGSLWRCSLDGSEKEELGRLGQQGSLMALHIVEPSLTILGPPRVAAGTPVTLRVGSLPALVGAVTYEWYKDGVLIAGANDAEYTIPSATHADAGEYDLRITDESKGIYLSAPFVLTVVDALPVGGLTAMALLLAVLLLAGASRLTTQRM